MKLEELRVYQMSMQIGEAVWDEVSNWSYFEKDTVGKQFVRSADSIAANISEGYGRYHFKQNKLFLYYARGSYKETCTWLRKAVNRGLISEDRASHMDRLLEDFGPRLNNYIRSIGPICGQVKEDQAPYGSDPFYDFPLSQETPDNNS